MRWLADRTLAHLRDLPDGPVVLDRYQLREEIGRGGMGIVYRATDRDLDRDVAVKVLSATTPGLADRLRREARILGRLEHPGILPIHDIGTLPDGRLFYVMKLVRGERLDAHAARDLPLSERLRIIDRLCDAVAFAHAHGVIHRDLKPENVMIGAFGEVLVLDWGVAKVKSQVPNPDSQSSNSQNTNSQNTNSQDTNSQIPMEESTHHGTVLGTPGYMAPEQAAGADGVDERADVFAIGGILSFLVPDAPPPLRAIAARARSVEPANRYSSVSALAIDVQRHAAGLAVDAYREGPLERLGRVARRHRTPILLVMAYLLMRILLLVLADA